MAASFGRGAMTNHWIDIAQSDCILIIGSNAAENHPISFKWVLKAKAHGAKIITADPRFTRTAARSDLYVPLRSGTDIALIGSVINYALTHDLVNWDYLATHTNASFLVDPELPFDAGRFGAIVDGAYTKEHWGFQLDDKGGIIKDPTLKDPNCVYSVLKRHFSRYTIERASNTTGTPADKLRRLCEVFTATHLPNKSGTVMYAMGATQHTHGTQNIRSYAILQLLMGNIGVAGGGINALRGESNVQGSTDHGILFHIIPGYLRAPEATDGSLDDYLKRSTPVSVDPRSANWWQNYPAYTVSLLKAFWAEHATPGNDFAYHYLPKHGKENCSHIALFEAMARGKIKGLVLMGQNPAVAGPDASSERKSLEKLDWLVAADLWETETSTFWKRPGADPASIKTEVFLLPAAASVEKCGSITNSGRWAQWRYQAVAPPGNAKSDLWILDRIFKKVKELYKAGGVFPSPIVELSWAYGDGEEPDPALVARDINGKFHEDRTIKGQLFKKGDLVPSFALLQRDGSTSSGNWLYCASFTDKGNMMARRHASNPKDDPIGLNPNWAWCWPVNRRILYNRASCDARGRPLAPNKPVVVFDWKSGKWLGDVPDGGWPPLKQPDGRPNEAGKYSFIMLPDGQACLYAPGLADGPLPEHYEPLESPVDNLLSDQQYNPVIKIWRPEEIGRADKFPIVATTYRVSEHWQSGSMSRNLPWLVELQPSAFAEMSEELAARKNINNGDMVEISTIRGKVQMYAVVTPRLKPFHLGSGQVDQIGIIWHFGYAGMAKGATANMLTPHVGDANTMIPEYKAFLCDVRRIAKEGAS